MLLANLTVTLHHADFEIVRRAVHTQVEASSMG